MSIKILNNSLTKIKTRKFVLFVFLFLNFIHLDSDYFSTHLGIISDRWIFYITYFNVSLILILLYFYNKKIKLQNLTRKFKGILFLFFIFSCFLTLYGILKFNPQSYLLDDSTTILSFICFILIGSNPIFFEDLLKIGTSILLFALTINVLATLIIKTSYQHPSSNLLDYANIRISSARDYLSYGTQYSLALWSILLMTSYNRSNKFFLFILLTLCFVFLQQILFQKRAGSFRVLLYFISFLIIIPHIIKSSQVKKMILRKKLVLFFVILIAFPIAFSIFPIEYIEEQLTGLISKLGGKTGNSGVIYSTGFWGIFTLENERFNEVFQILNDFSVFDFFSGKGFGGMFYENVYFNMYRQSAHVGIMFFFLKGGMFYLFIYLWIILYALFTYKYQLYSLIGLSCFIFVLINFIMHFIEGWFAYSSNSYENMLIGAAIGYLVQNKKKSFRFKKPIDI